MALPADGSPTLEGHPDDGKDHGKVWSNEADMVSEDHGVGSRCSSPPQSVDCATSSSKDEVGNAGTSSSSGSSTTSSSDDEANNEDQDDFKSRLLYAKVLVDKLLVSLDQLEQFELKCSRRRLAGRSSKVHRASAASQLLEIPPPNFKFIQDIGVAQEDTAPSTSLEFTSELDKQEEPILRPENSRPIGTSQHHQVGLEEDGAHVTSVTGINGKRTRDSVAEEQPPAKRIRDNVAEEELPAKTTKCSDDPSRDEGRIRSTTKKVDAAQEDNPPSKLSFGIVLPSSFKLTCELDKQEEPILRPEDSSPISASPQPLAGWRNLVTYCRARRLIQICRKADKAKEENPTANPSHQVGLKEDVADVKSVTGINGNRTKDSDVEEHPSHVGTPAKRTKDTVAEAEIPNKWTRDCDDAKQEPSAKRIRESQTEDVLPSKRTRNSVAEEEPPAKRIRDTVAEEELPAKTTKYSDDPSWDEAVQRIDRKMAWSYGEEWEDVPIQSTPLFTPYRKIHNDPLLLRVKKAWEDAGLSSFVLSPSPRILCEDPGLSSPVLSPSPRILCEDPGRSSPVLSPSSRMPRKRPVLSSPVLSPVQETIHENPFLSSPDFNPSPLTHCEDPIFSPRVFSPPPRMPCEDPILSPRVFSPSPSTHSENSPLSSPGFCFWMETEKDIEEEPTPSTSGGIATRESSRDVGFKPFYVLSDSD